MPNLEPLGSGLAPKPLLDAAAAALANTFDGAIIEDYSEDPHVE